MVLNTCCKFCKKDFNLDFIEISRAELENNKGRYFEIRCPFCEKKTEYHVNDIWADKKSGVKVLSMNLGLVILLLFIFIMFDMDPLFYAIVILPLAYYYIVKRNEKKSIELFNSYQVSRTRNE